LRAGVPLSDPRRGLLFRSRCVRIASPQRGV
jgi:hypothetical protein